MSLCLASASYDVSGKRLLDRVSIDVPPGRVTAVVGPNGAGKSTALKLLSGDLVPCEGTCSIDGADVGTVSPQDLARRRAVLPQSSHLSFGFRVGDLVALGRLPHGETGATLSSEALISEAMARAGCFELKDRDYLTLSGGERQRTHLARTLAQIAEPVGDLPRYFLLDEPTNALDLVHQISLLDLMRQLAAEGVGVLMIVHDLNHALGYADYVYVLKDGKLVGEGEPKSVMTPQLIKFAWGVDVASIESPVSGVSYLFPDRAATSALPA